jgi:uncharacterized membrane protein
MTVVAMVWRQARSLDAVVQTLGLTGGPHVVWFFQNIQNRFKFVKSKQMPSIAPQITKFCMRLEWCILNNFLNCANFIFPIEIMLKILEQIQIWIFLLILKGFKPFGKNLINSPKFLT